MNPAYTRLKMIFLGVFVFAVIGMLIYHMFWVWPADRCEADGKWWDAEGRVCAQPVLISDITGRTIQDKQDQAAAKAIISEVEKAAPAAQAAPAPAAPAAKAPAPKP